MSKYIKTIPLSEIERIAIVRGNGRSLAQVKGTADLIMNAGFYDFLTGKPTHHLKADGTVLAKETWGCWGFGWDSGPDIHMEALPAERKNYIGAYELLSPMVGINDRLSYGAELGGVRGRTAMALTGDKLILWCSKDGTGDGRTPEGVREELYRLGAETAIMLDGGGSSQCDFGGGEVIASSRRVHNYICVWLKKKEDKPMNKKVCLDPGHGPGCVNGSPDGSYKEHEFAWDMAERCRAILERHGVTVVMTRDEAGYPSLAERCSISNKVGVDMFVSLHSNASGDGKSWTDPSGYLIYTSAGPETAARNVAARAVLKRAREAGVSIRGGGLGHNLEYAVLKGTSAPAMIVEHGFHTNREDTALLKTDAYRAKLAEADCKGILDFLGITWKDEAAPETQDKPWYAAVQAWVREIGISDGTRPLENCTRAEEWTIAYRLYQAIKAGK